MPFTIPTHEAERKILEKRLALLKLFDDLVRAGFELEHFDDPVVQEAFARFSEVLTPSDVCSGIKAIFEDKPHLFSN